MRIISQNKQYDVPYEKTIIEVNSECIYADTLCAEDTYIEIARYATHERCLEVMQDIQRKYGCGAKICELPEK